MGGVNVRVVPQESIDEDSDGPTPPHRNEITARCGPPPPTSPVPDIQTPLTTETVVWVPNDLGRST
jgi:hypothetical protein